MKRLLIGISIPLLFLALSLLPSEMALAQPMYFSTNPATLDLIAEVNSLRASNNLPPYQVDAVLMNIAQVHAEYIASTGVETVEKV